MSALRIFLGGNKTLTPTPKSLTGTQNPLASLYVIFKRSLANKLPGSFANTARRTHGWIFKTMALMVVACGHGGIHPRPPLAFLKERHIASAQFVKLLEFAHLTRLGLGHR